VLAGRVRPWPGESLVENAQSGDPVNINTPPLWKSTRGTCAVDLEYEELVHAGKSSVDVWFGHSVMATVVELN
jgi:hypothetical protein